MEAMPLLLQIRKQRLRDKEWFAQVTYYQQWNREGLEP